MVWEFTLPSTATHLFFWFNKSRLYFKIKYNVCKNFSRDLCEVPHTEIHLVIAFKSSPIPRELLPWISFCTERSSRCEMRKQNNVCTIRVEQRVMYDDTFILSFHSSGAIPIMKGFFSPSLQWFIYLESDPCVSALSGSQSDFISLPTWWNHHSLLSSCFYKGLTSGSLILHVCFGP
jgi:hypothetical protein